MAKISQRMTLAAAALLIFSSMAFAQSGGGAGGASAGTGSGGATGTAGAPGMTPGTNSLGTANASGGGGTGGGAPGGATSSIDGHPSTGDPITDSQDRAVDKKVKSICKGC